MAECQLTNAEGVIATWKAGSAMDAETGGWKFAEDQNICVRHQNTFLQMLSEYRGEDGGLTVEKSGRCPLEQVIRVVSVTRGGRPT